MPQERDESFSRDHRLRKSGEFKLVFSRGRRTATRYFVIYTLPNRLPFSRLGIQVKAKIANAVRRNSIKRMVREVFRKNKSEFTQPVDLIFIANKDILLLDYHAFENEFKHAVGKYLS